MDGAPSGGLGARMVRAARLDPALYRDVAANGDTRAAALAVLLAAFSSGIALGALAGAYGLASDAGGKSPAHVWEAIGEIVFVALTQATPWAIFGVLIVWPVWAAGLWLIGSRLTAGTRGAASFGKIARAIAFAQIPAVVSVLIPVVLLLFAAVQGATAFSDSVPPLLQSLISTLYSLVGVWVLIATFVGIRESLGLSDARTFVALVTVAAGLMLPLPLIAAGVAFISDLGGASYDTNMLTYLVLPGYARAFDFNLGFLTFGAVSFAASSVFEAMR